MGRLMHCRQTAWHMRSAAKMACRAPALLVGRHRIVLSQFMTVAPGIFGGIVHGMELGRDAIWRHIIGGAYCRERQWLAHQASLGGIRRSPYTPRKHLTAMLCIMPPKYTRGGMQWKHSFQYWAALQNHPVIALNTMPPECGCGVACTLSIGAPLAQG